MLKYLAEQLKWSKVRELFKNSLFYFGLVSMALFGFLLFGSEGLAKLDNTNNPPIVFLNPFFKNGGMVSSSDSLFAKDKAVAKETPDLKLIGDGFIAGISTPRVLAPQTLGSLLGGGDQNQDRNEITDYLVKEGDTPSTIARDFGISLTTLLWANPNITRKSILKKDDSLVIPPGDGVIYSVKSGDTLSKIAKKYKSSADKIIDANGLKNEGDLFVEDILFLPDGQIPPRAAPMITQIPVPSTFFIYPTEGIISQGRHGYLGRAVDIANKCGTPIYAAAGGIVQRAQFSSEYGNFITLAHSNETSSYYGHEETLMVKAGDVVSTGQLIGFMGRTGREATGCHVHFETRGTENPFTRYPIGTPIKYR